jgi:hypothetical protein
MGFVPQPWQNRRRGRDFRGTNSLGIGGATGATCLQSAQPTIVRLAIQCWLDRRCSSTRSATFRSSCSRNFARATGAGIQAVGQHTYHPRGCSTGCGDTAESCADGSGRKIPGRSLLPAERLPCDRAAAPGTEGRHPAAGQALCPSLRAADEQAHRDHPGRGHPSSGASLMDGKHPGAGELYRTPGHPLLIQRPAVHFSSA